MNKTKINWTDLTWNPMSGCERVSAGCRYCYAETLAENKRGTRAFPAGFELTIRPHKLREVARIKQPSLVFCNSMSDAFWAKVPDSYRDDIFETIERHPQHRYQILTKRPEEAARYFSRRAVPSSVWLGVTVEHVSTVHRIDTLRSIAAPVRFISAEPLIGHLGDVELDGIDWLITGGESGLHLADPRVARQRALVERVGRQWRVRDDRKHWVTDLRDAAARAGTALWHKQWGGTRPDSAGRLIDGRTHDGMPWHVPGAMPEGWGQAA